LNRHSLVFRVILWLGGAITVILLLFSLALYYFFSQSFRATWENRLYRQALQIHDEDLPRILRRKSFDSRTLDGYAAALLRGKNLIAQSPHWQPKELKRLIHQKKSFSIVDHGETLTLYYRYPFDAPFKGVLLLKRGPVDNDLEDLVDTLLFLDPALLILILLVAYKVLDRTLRPIRLAAQTAARTSVDNLPHPIPRPKERDEIRDLVDAFNTMAERLAEGIERIERFNSDVSHELRTPLTIMLGEIDIALRKERDAAQLRHTLEIVRTEAERLERLVKNLLTLSRYDADSIRNSFEETALDQLLLEAIDLQARSIREKRLLLRIPRLEAIVTRANPTLIRSLFANLLDNAVKYSSEGKNITLELFRDRDGGIRFRITDEGVGIPADKVEKVTERFYRVDEARSRKTPGFGLGLALVKKIVELHGGTLHIRSKEGKGTTVELRLSPSKAQSSSL
jgi:signal transduction histidine kinase